MLYMYFEFINDILLIYRFKKKSKQQYLFDRNRLKFIQPDKYYVHGVLILAFSAEKVYVYINYHKSSNEKKSLPLGTKDCLQKAKLDRQTLLNACIV